MNFYTPEFNKELGSKFDIKDFLRNINAMNEIDKIISDYLQVENTDYAIMINGDWGCGKTYYLNNDFKNLVERMVVPKSNLNKTTQKIRRFFGKRKLGNEEGIYYKPAYISLYGLSSAEDFYQRVFFGVKGWDNNGVIRFFGVGASKLIEYVGVSVDGKDAKAITFINTNRVMVFDDLERICEDKISIKEVLGLINSYSEHDKRKVVIACNEDAFVGAEVEDELRKAYKKYKEKSVRFTCNFHSDIAGVYGIVVKQVKDDSYRDFLQNDKDRILYVFNIGGRNNLRTLIFFIDAFEQVFDKVNNVEYKDDVLTNLMVTILIYTMEYKEGKSADDLKSLNPINLSINTSLLGIKKNNEQDDYPTAFRKKYSELIDSFVANDVFVDFIMDGYLNITELNNEIHNIDKTVGSRKLKPEGIEFQRLKSYSSLGDDEVLQVVENILGYVDKDNYNIYDLMYVYAELVKYDYWHFSGFNLSEGIKNRIRESMDRQKQSHIYNPMFEMKIPMWDKADNTKEYQVYQEMKQYAISINREAMVRDNRQDADVFMQAAEKEDVKTLSAFRIDPKNEISISGFDWNKIWNLIEKGSNPVACELCNCVMYLTSVGNLQPDDVRKIVNEFIPLLEKYDTQKDHRVRAMYIDELKKHICGIIGRIA